MSKYSGPERPNGAIGRKALKASKALSPPDEPVAIEATMGFVDQCMRGLRLPLIEALPIFERDLE